VVASIPFAGSLAASACAPSIGGSCTQSSDCSVQGNRACDSSQPGGYCTVINCTPNSCPDNAVCTTFGTSLPGCFYNDYDAPSRTARSLCMAHCSQDSDCRQNDGYVCRDPRQPPWSAAIVDSNQSQKVCIVPSTQPQVPSIMQPAACGGGDAGDGAAPSVDASTEAQSGEAGEVDATDGG
jgi:hypothetical protein